MASAILIRTDGTVDNVELSSEGGALNTMYESIGCRSVDVVRLTGQIDMWVDDEGMYTQSLNPLATLLARRYGRVHQGYFGPALIAGFTADGETVNLTDDQANAIRAQLAAYVG